jgi:hypothetical protein
MTCYIRTYMNGFEPCHDVWKVEDNTIFRLGITNPISFAAEPGEEIIAAVRRQCASWFESGNSFEKTILEPGEYYPRMARPSNHHPSESPGRNPGHEAEAKRIAIARGQLLALTRQLKRICETVHPEGGMLDAYGHDIRNVLILACTEVESQWKGVLSANGVRGRNLTRRHYKALGEAMRLHEYAASFHVYPWLAALRPFSGWGYADRGLSWYDAYNAVKHNREGAFSKGTLHDAFEAVSACFVMLVAQFGTHEGLGHDPELTSTFRLAEVPRWPLSEIYIFPYGAETTAAGLRAVDYPFNLG